MSKTASNGMIFKVAGPLVVAENMGGSRMFEVVNVGKQRLVGEIIRLENDNASIQVYEDTSGLTVGDPIFKTGLPLSLEMGPGILNDIYDGIQRPLERIFNDTKSVFIQRGLEVDNLNRAKLWEFKPFPGIKLGDMLTGGDIFGVVRENGLFREHRIMVPPNAAGRVTFLASAGNYKILDDMLVLETPTGNKEKFQMMHKWPIRDARPIKEKLSGKQAMLTCQRVIDALFPVTLR